jgi:hypothetical protein
MTLASYTTLTDMTAQYVIFRHVLACLDNFSLSHAVLTHAEAMTSSIDARLT